LSGPFRARYDDSLRERPLGKIAWKLKISFWGLCVSLNKIMSGGPPAGLSFLQGAPTRLFSREVGLLLGEGEEDRREEVQRRL